MPDVDANLNNHKKDQTDDLLKDKTNLNKNEQTNKGGEIANYQLDNKNNNADLIITKVSNCVNQNNDSKIKNPKIDVKLNS